MLTYGPTRRYTILYNAIYTSYLLCTAYRRVYPPPNTKVSSAIGKDCQICADILYLHHILIAQILHDGHLPLPIFHSPSRPHRASLPPTPSTTPASHAPIFQFLLSFLNPIHTIVANANCSQPRWHIAHCLQRPVIEHDAVHTLRHEYPAA